MFKFLKSKKTDEIAPPQIDKENTIPSSSWFSRLNQKLKKTRTAVLGNLSNLVLGKKQIDAAILEELETSLLIADVGVKVTQQILDKITEQVARKELHDPQKLIETLRIHLESILVPYAKPISVDHKPFIILMVGVNGVGKTTSIAKLAHFYQQQGKKVMLAAGDTFRAAGVEQLQIWGERNHIPVIAQQTGSDSASVIFDAVQAAKARNYDVLIADTAGRLHTQDHLMNELAKIKRVISKLEPTAPHEVMLVIDAGMGQNALNQAQQFHQAIGLTGITLTKLDGTAKGGIIFAIADSLQLPIRFIGIGEQIDDLRPFDQTEFVEALFSTTKND